MLNDGDQARDKLLCTELDAMALKLDAGLAELKGLIAAANPPPGVAAAQPPAAARDWQIRRALESDGRAG